MTTLSTLLKSACYLTALISLASPLLGGEAGKKTVTSPEVEDRWKFALSMPGWMPALDGTVGLKGVNSHVDVDAYDVLRRADMLASFRGSAHKGRFGIQADFIYMSLSDGVGSNSVIKKVDVQLDQMLGDLGVSWRLLEGPRGYLDLIAGARYTYIYQQLATQVNGQRVDEVSTALVDDVGERIRSTIAGSGLRELVADRIESELVVLEGRKPTLAVAPLAGRRHRALSLVVNRLVDQRRAELRTAFDERLQAATEALRAEAQRKIDQIKRELSDKIATALKPKLKQTVSRTDDWIDPYVGLRARYNFTPAIYAIFRGDVGGFGVGSKFTWQTEGALGCQLTRSIFAEVGYRALGVDYESDGLIYDVITHGVQVTMGIMF
jgi:hypothetical protein